MGEPNPYAESCKAYCFGRELGRGAYGTVYSATERGTTRKVAIKWMSDVFDNDSAEYVVRELQLHRHVDVYARGTVARLTDVLLPDDPSLPYPDVVAVFERMDCDLGVAMQALMPPQSVQPRSQTQPLQQQQQQQQRFERVRAVTFGLVGCVARLHACGVVHRDLKPQNVLVDSLALAPFAGNDAPAVVRLCDLGMARHVSMSCRDGKVWTDYVTTRWYRSPEACADLSCAASAAMDMWSVGCILAEMLLGGRPLFPGKDTLSQAQLIGEALGPMHAATAATYSARSLNPDAAERMIAAGGAATPSSGLRARLEAAAAPDLAIDLMTRLLTYDPADRLTAEGALGHPLFADLGWGGPQPRCVVPAAFFAAGAGSDRQSVTRELVRCKRYLSAVAGRALPGISVACTRSAYRQLRSASTQTQTQTHTGLKRRRGASM